MAKYIGTKIAKSLETVPVFFDNTPMYSLYKPARDSSSFASLFSKDTHFFVVGGAGTLLHIKEFCSRFPCKILCVEENESDLQFLAPFIKDLPSCVELCTIENLAQKICDNYIVAVYGGLEFFALKSWEMHTDFQAMNAIKKQLQNAIEKVRLDYSVQAHFGRAWQHNIMQNIRLFSNENLALQKVKDNVRQHKTAAIIAAGPTLDSSIKELEKNRDLYYIIATDTAWRALCLHKIKCDCVVCIDAQHLSLSHFLPVKAGREHIKNIDFVFDIASCHNAIKTVKDCGGNVHFCANAHPLSRYISREYQAMTEIETGTGTVTIAAACVAVKMGFTMLKLFGADFGYIKGKAYTKGTYLCDLYQKNASRLCNAETKFCALMYRTPLIKKGNNAFTTQVLDSYRVSLFSFLQESGFIQKEAIFVNKNNIASSRAVFQKNDLNTFLSNYKKLAFSLLNAPCDNLMQNNIFMTLLPFIAWAKSHYRKKTLHELLDYVIKNCDK